MAVVGIGVDVVDVDRFAQAAERTPGLVSRVLTVQEAQSRRLASLAARFAAKEALAKALGAPPGLRWHDAEVRSEADGRPVLVTRGSVARALDDRGVAHAHLSLTHDAGMAVALVVLET